MTKPVPFSLGDLLVQLIDASFFFFNDTATTEIYTLSLHDALPISAASRPGALGYGCYEDTVATLEKALTPGPYILGAHLDRKSTRLNSSHLVISYAVFCLKKKSSPPNHNHQPGLSPSFARKTQAGA